MDSRRMCPHCRAFITNKDKICPYCNEQVGPRAIDRRSPADFLGGLIPHARFNTIVILLANFGLYLVSTLYSMRAGGGGGFSGIDGATLFAFGAKFGAAIAAGQWWRLVTAGFLHGGLLHILMNSWVLFDLAPQVEEMFGASRMWVIYFVSSVGGFYLSNLWNPRSL
jgi:rhomboid protease GluP